MGFVADAERQALVTATKDNLEPEIDRLPGNPTVRHQSWDRVTTEIKPRSRPE